MRIDIITIFPEVILPVLQAGILRRAQARDILTVNVHNLRDFTTDSHQTVDDYPYGGGAGMILKPEPLFAAIRALQPESTARVIYLTPQGTPFNQARAEAFSLESHLILICGRYKGIDERVRVKLITDEISIGDYVLSGGEIPALVLVDAIGRVLPRALGNYESAQEDSFSQGLLDCPHYTRPAEFEGMKVPDLLLSGHHKKITLWQREQSLKRTVERRPDLLKNVELSTEDVAYLSSLNESDVTSHA